MGQRSQARRDLPAFQRVKKMRNKYLSLTTALLLTGALAAGMACGCFSGDCQAFPGATQVKMAQCHHDSAQAKAKDPVRRDCCGKCQIEKWAVLAGNIVSMGAVLSKAAATDIPLFTDVPEAAHGSRPCRIDRSPPEIFFTQHVLNFTFSFRAPPQG